MLANFLNKMDAVIFHLRIEITSSKNSHFQILLIHYLDLRFREMKNFRGWFKKRNNKVKFKKDNTHYNQPQFYILPLLCKY